MAKVQFDESLAATYDADSAFMFDPAVLDPTVDFLSALADGGAALEFGVGTGRVVTLCKSLRQNSQTKCSSTS